MVSILVLTGWCQNKKEQEKDANIINTLNQEQTEVVSLVHGSYILGLHEMVNSYANHSCSQLCCAGGHLL